VQRDERGIPKEPNRSRSSLLTALHEVIEKHCEEQGLEPVFALTDALTDIRHLADIHAVNFAEIDAQAYAGYIEELNAATSDELESCPKCGARVMRSEAYPDEGTGDESGRTFYYCSERCRETH
jgi:DNA-directed RNA polymerase subunit M/transcription elongation factor TFIIS